MSAPGDLRWKSCSRSARNITIYFFLQEKHLSFGPSLHLELDLFQMQMFSEIYSKPNWLVPRSLLGLKVCPIYLTDTIVVCWLSPSSSVLFIFSLWEASLVRNKLPTIKSILLQIWVWDECVRGSKETLNTPFIFHCPEVAIVLEGLHLFSGIEMHRPLWTGPVVF